MLVALDVLLVLALEHVHEVIDHAIVKVFTAQVIVSCGRLDLEGAVFDGQDGDVESAAAEIEDEDVGLLSIALHLFQTVRDDGGGRLADDSEDVQAGEDPGMFGGLALRVVEVLKKKKIVLFTKQLIFFEKDNKILFFEKLERKHLLFTLCSIKL